MDFSCDRCKRRFSTSDEPTPGCAYRIRCDCGNLISVALPLPPEPRGEREVPAPEPRVVTEVLAPGPQVGPEVLAPEPRVVPDVFAPGPPAEPDPFAPPAGGEGPTPARRRPLAKRDPLARVESAEFRITGEVSFDDVLRRARWRGFLSGCAAGALAAGVVAAVLVLSGPRPTPPGIATAPSQPAGLAEAPPARPGAGAAAPSPTAAPRPSAPGGRGAPQQRAAVSSQKVTGDGGADADRIAPRPAIGLSLREGAARAAQEPAATADPSPAVAPPPAPAPAPGVAEEARHPAPAPPPDAIPAPRALDERAVAAALRDRQDALEGCAAATLGGTEGAHGLALRLVFVVEPTGRVSTARIDDPEIERAPLGVCISRLARALSFAPFDGERVEVALPVRVGGGR